MGQSWILLNLDKRQCSGHLGKLGEFWGSGTGLNTFYRLLVPVDIVSPRVFSPPAASPNANATATTAPAADENLFTKADEHKIKFYELRRKRMVRQNGDTGPASPPTPLAIGSWAGDRIVCIGEYTDTSGLPSNLLTPTELTTLESSDSDSLYSYSKDNFNPVSGYASRVLKVEADVVNPQDKALTWVLRNLTKKVYVDLAKYKEKDIGGIDQILLTNICWTNEPDSTLEYAPSRGRWAGDRFDVNVLESVQGELEGGEGPWKDVTEEMAKIVGEIWRSQY